MTQANSIDWPRPRLANFRMPRHLRVVEDFEASISAATAFLYAASAMLLARRVARSA